ncbi:GlxA family transcriptional regulator [Maritimibacter sp. 55A14]|uniref:GlxA family transcriptional regulator n=1 Tax=Maritimibacter sp. 55A14 TaxID=2174844 RepID=UPI000D61BCAA|nr:GlxA family transcriptional regulator [Maritimibacter sp. 55A14]PWE33853.1 GlxA family transcriptional regulator [Maritimibacter sp. 55A14]
MNKENSIFRAGDTALRFGILVLSDSNTLSLAAVVDPLRGANRRAGAELYRWQIHSADGAPVRLTSGISFPAPALPERPDFDVLVVVAGFRLDEQATRPLLARLRRIAPHLRGLGGVDGGSWFLARAGLLDGHTATTHWEDLELFATRFPAVDVVRDRYTISGRCFTTGGASPALDMMLHLIRARQGPELAMRVAGAFIYDTVHPGHAPQSLVPGARLAETAPQVARAVGIMEDALEAPPPIARIARAVGLSPRHLETRFRRALGTTPGAFFLGLRLAEARRLLLDTGLPVQQVALRTGFGSQAAFARAFRNRFGMSASALRRVHSG